MDVSCKALIFDLDGTLAHSIEAHNQSWAEALNQFEIPFTRQRMNQLGGVSLKETIRILLEEADMQQDQAAVLAAKEEAFYRRVEQGIRETPLVEQVVRYFYGKLPMAVGTGCETLMAQRVLEAMGIRHYFDQLVGVEQVLHGKPAPDIFLRCAELLDTQPECCMVFEDAEAGVQAGRRAKMQIIDVRQGWPTAAELLSL
ncbi:HAD family hydrolase [Dongshaea marina]|uniref:HAD family hydrolase n=1 Tax=Dongshaea marina TaxID=2047966 RepID=UPI000D3E60FB|nr:beta-phosphoglucomutase family hydrolase [Dongshaea marina]